MDRVIDHNVDRCKKKLYDQNLNNGLMRRVVLYGSKQASSSISLRQFSTQTLIGQPDVY